MTHTAIINSDAAQREFDEKYITASEIMKDLGITRPTLYYARSNNKLPAPIVLNDGTVFLWEREIIRPFLDAWKLALNVRRGF